MIVHDKASGSQKERWRISVSYKDAMGVSRRKWAVAHSLKEAKQKEAELTLELRDPSSSSKASKMTLDQLFSSYMAMKGKVIKNSTISNFNHTYDNWIKPSLGACDVAKLSVSDFERWKTDVDFSKLSFSSKKVVFSVFRNFLATSKKRYGIDLLTMLNAVGDFTKSRNDFDEEKPLRFWTEEQFKKFLSIYDGSFPKRSAWNLDCFQRDEGASKCIFALCFYAGLRVGEANALYISDFHDDGKKPYIDVSKSVTFAQLKKGEKMQVFIAPPKNKTSIRKVPIPEVLADILRKHIADFSSKVEPKRKKDPIFLAGGVEPIPVTKLRLIFEAGIKKAQLPPIMIHGLRHSYVSVLINNHVPLETISRLVGHSTPTMTWKVYSHLYPETLSDAVDVFDKK